MKGQGQSLLEIYQSHGDEMPVSIATLHSYIDRKVFGTIRNIDLAKKVKYPLRYKKKPEEPTNKAFLAGRSYDDFLAAVTADPLREVVEMDTVVGPAGTGPCLLTFLFRKSNFMLAFWMPRKTSAEVAKAFARIRRTLGNGLYSATFGIILTDNGSEFADPLSVECDPETGERLASVYYCEPGSLLNGNCPGTIAKAFLDEKVPALNGYRFIKPDEAKLTPSLIR